MALSKEDLSAIAHIVDETLEVKLDVLLDKKLDEKLDKHLDKKLDEKLEQMEQRLDERMDRKMEQMEQRLDERMDAKFEVHLQPIKADISKLQSDVSSIRLKQENVFEPQLRLLAENYVPAAKRFMEASDQIEDMQEDIKLLKRVAMDHSEKLSKIS